MTTTAHDCVDPLTPNGAGPAHLVDQAGLTAAVAAAIGALCRARVVTTEGSLKPVSRGPTPTRVTPGRPTLTSPSDASSLEEKNMTSPYPWDFVLWQQVALQAEPPPAPLCTPGHHEVDPAHSTAILTARGLRRRDRCLGAVSGGVWAGRTATELSVDLAVTMPGRAGGEAVSVRVTGSELAAVYGSWLLHGAVEIDGVRAPLLFDLSPANHLQSGGVALTVSGGFDGRAAGVQAPWSRRRADLQIALTLHPAAERPSGGLVAPVGRPPFTAHDVGCVGDRSW